MQLLKKTWPYLFALTLTLLILRPILGPVWYPMHDTTHVARLYLMEESIRGGQFPPIWAEGINSGYGYPLFHFYAPIFYYTALLISAVAGSYILALKLTLGLFLVLGALGVMGLVRKWGRGAMLVAATLFATSPYLAVNIYVRGAYAEFAAMCLFPVVLLAWQNLSSRPRQVVAGVVMAIFLMSHNLIPLLALPLVALYILVTHRQNLLVLVIPSILTLLLSTSYLTPLFFERSFVQAEVVAKTSNYQLHYVEVWQIWNSTWGFGGSALGVEDGFSFKMGKLQRVLAALGTLTLVLKKHRYWLLGAMALYSLFMTTSAASSLWQNIPYLPLTQFPWRHLALAAPLLSVLAATPVYSLTNRLLRVGMVVLTCALAISLNLKYFAPQATFLAQESDYINPKYLDTVAGIIPEYMPTWMTQDVAAKSELLTHQAGQTTINRAYYPTWQVSLDGQVVQAYPDQDGLLTISNPQASDNIAIRQVHTTVEVIGYALTLIGLSISIFWWFKK